MKKQVKTPPRAQFPSRTHPPKVRSLLTVLQSRCQNCKYLNELVSFEDQWLICVVFLTYMKLASTESPFLVLGC